MFIVLLIVGLFNLFIYCRDEMDNKVKQEGMKRLMSEGISGGQKRKKQKLSTEKKHPLMALNELRPNLACEISEDGPPHDRVFTACLTVNLHKFTGRGKSKKAAKACAAEMYLRWSTQLPDPVIEYKHTFPPQGLADEDFSCDSIKMIEESNSFFSVETTMEPQPQVSKPPDPTNNPVFLLNLHFPNISYDMAEEGQEHSKMFTARGKY